MISKLIHPFLLLSIFVSACFTEINTNNNSPIIELLKNTVKKDTVNEWNEWRSEHKDSVLNFRGGDFFKIKFKGFDLSNSNFSSDSNNKTLLNCAVFIDCKLIGSNFSGTDLSFTEFINSNCEKINLEYSFLGQTQYDKTNLKGASLKNAKILTACFKNTNIDSVDFDNADIEGIILVNINLCKAKNLKLEQLCNFKFIDQCVFPPEMLNALFYNEYPGGYRPEGCMNILQHYLRSNSHSIKKEECKE